MLVMHWWVQLSHYVVQTVKVIAIPLQVAHSSSCNATQTSLCTASSTPLSTWHCLYLLLNAVLRPLCCWLPTAADRYLLPERLSAANLLHAGAAVNDGRERRMPDRYIDPAPHTIRTASTTHHEIIGIIKKLHAQVGAYSEYYIVNDNKNNIHYCPKVRGRCR